MKVAEKKSPKKVKGKDPVKMTAGAMDQFVRRGSPTKRLASPSKKSGASDGKDQSKGVIGSPSKQSSAISAVTKTTTPCLEQIIRPATSAEATAFRSPPTTPIRNTRLQGETEGKGVMGHSRQWSLISTTSDSESLPSPTNILSFFPATPESPSKGAGKSVLAENDGSPSARGRNGGRIIGSFRESLGGTLHEID